MTRIALFLSTGWLAVLCQTAHQTGSQDEANAPRLTIATAAFVAR
jgi:hypothetical protein